MRQEPRPIGVGDRFTLTAGRRRVAALPCGAPAGTPYGVHLELFVDGWVVLVPSGIGIRPPWVGTSPYVESGACEHADRDARADRRDRGARRPAARSATCSRSGASRSGATASRATAAP